MADLGTRFGTWLASKAPRREELERSRWFRLFAARALRSDLWRFTRRSVPRGVAVGLFVGVFLLIPGVQIIGAAIVSAPLRANFPLAAALTFLTNPFTTPFLLGASLWIGNLLGFHADLAAFNALRLRGAGVRDWLGWLFSDAAPALVSGLAVIALASAAIGFILSKWLWRWWMARKWRRRGHATRLAGTSPAA